MPVWIPPLVRKPVIHHDFTADERLQWEGRQHVEAKAATELSSGRFMNSFCLQTGNIDHEVVRGEIVQNVPFGFIAKGQKSS